MTYKETIKYLYNQLPVYQNIGSSAYKEGLDNSLALDAYFAHPHKRYKTIHIAGTNGKGSTSHLLAAILQQSGYKVGLYTSPHLLDFRERIRINGEKISEQYVVDFVAEHRKAFEPIHPSFFELTMMMSFLYFADMYVDVAIIEVGLGGRLDSTNIITPDLCVITNISLDHTQFLGNVISKIALEKAGIIKKNIPVAIGEASGEIRKVFEETADRVGAPIVFTEDNQLILSSKQTKDGLQFETQEYPALIGELSGYAQVKNANTVLNTVELLKQVGYNVPNEAVYDGFFRVTELTGLMGRWQIVQNESPKIVCDTGHNAGGIAYVADQLRNEKYDRLHIVLGMVSDKDISSVLALLPKEAKYYFTKASIPRAMSETELRDKGISVGLQGEIYVTVENALQAARSDAGENDFVFVGGSNFVVAEALETLGFK